jgi:hypothetical protein
MPADTRAVGAQHFILRRIERTGGPQDTEGFF